MKENIKKEKLLLKLGIFIFIENENLKSSIEAFLYFIVFCLIIFFYSFFKSIFMDPGYLPDPINLEYNLILQNLEIKEDNEFKRYEESINDENNSLYKNSLISNKDTQNTNNNHLYTQDRFLLEKKNSDSIGNIKDEIFEDNLVVKKPTKNNFIELNSKSEFFGKDTANNLNGVEQNAMKCINKTKITKNSDLELNENHKYNISPNINDKGNENAINKNMKKDENNCNNYLIKDNNNLSFKNLNFEYLKEKNDCNIIKTRDIPNDNIIEKPFSSIDYNISPIINVSFLNSENNLFTNDPNTLKGNFSIYNNHKNEDKIISPIICNVSDTSCLDRIKEKNFQNTYNSIENKKKKKDKKDRSNKNKLSKKSYSSLGKIKIENEYGKHYTELNVNKCMNTNDSICSSQNFFYNQLNKFGDSIKFSRGFVTDSSSRETETPSIGSNNKENVFQKILKMRNNFIKDFGHMVFNGPICNSEGIRYRNYLEKYLNFSNLKNISTYSNSYLHSILYNQSNIYILYSFLFTHNKI